MLLLFGNLYHIFVEWEFMSASIEIRQAYRQFIGAVVELIDGEVPSEEFREVALTVYSLFSGPEEEEAINKNISQKK